MKKIYITIYSSPLGNIILGSDGKALVGLWLKGQKYFLGQYKETENNDSLEFRKLQY